MSAVRTSGAGLLLATLACSCAPTELEERQSAVLNGEDSRLEAFAVPAEARGPLLGASAALVWSQHLVESAPDAVALRAPTAGAALGLCADEPFSSEPSAAFCSGVLIDDDLVATAAHCLSDDATLAARRCHDLRIVFGYASSAADRPIELGADQAFACRRIVVMEHDLAVIQLDRSVSATLSPRPIATAAAKVGDALVVASHGAGLPLKVELAAAVTEVSAETNTMTVAMDTFTGSSGGGLYNQALELVGVVSNGDVDWDEENGCARAAHSSVPREHASAADRLVRLVCGTGWPSARLCGKPPACGDGICGVGEAPTCPADCPAARCGDSLCEPSERGVCREDCSRYVDVPAAWLDDPAAYPAVPSDASPPPSTPAGCSVSPRSAAPLPLSSLMVLAPAFRLRARRRRRASRCHD